MQQSFEYAQDVLRIASLGLTIGLAGSCASALLIRKGGEIGTNIGAIASVLFFILTLLTAPIVVALLSAFGLKSLELGKQSFIVQHIGDVGIAFACFGLYVGFILWQAALNVAVRFSGSKPDPIDWTLGIVWRRGLKFRDEDG